MFGNKELKQELDTLAKRVEVLEGRSTDKYIVVQRTSLPLLCFPAIPGTYTPNLNGLHGLGRDATMKRIAADIGEIYGLIDCDVRRLTTGQILLCFEDINGTIGTLQRRVGYVMGPDQLQRFVEEVTEVLKTRGEQ